MKAIHLQTEYLTDPIGLGTAKPRFSWWCEGGVTQTAYRIVALRNRETVWDSGRVESPRMTHIPYEGLPLGSRDAVVWKVLLWDEAGEPGPWSVGSFELGLLEPSDWKAKWMTAPFRPSEAKRYPADCFRKGFRVTRPVRKARLYITACGLYEAVLNGSRVGDFVLAPGSTDYHRRIQYQTYDVTALLQEHNVLAITLADGWYRGSVGCFGQTAVFGPQTKVLCQLEVTCEDGSVGTIVSDEKFAWSDDGPIRFADLKDGEMIDARMKPSYSGFAAVCEEKIIPTASDNVFPKEQERLPGRLIVTPSGRKVIDFGQNLAGFLEMKLRGAAGQTVRVLLGEMLENGEFTQRNFQVKKPVRKFGKAEELALMLGKAEKLPMALQATPLQEIRFTCSGGEDLYKTKFAVFGFRYALVETEVPFAAADFTAIAVYSDLEQTGFFGCSHDGLNRLVENTRWSMKSNFLDVPTDCPTRERLGWTGDAQVFFGTGAYLMNTAPFFRKWLRDLQDNRRKNGVTMAVVPRGGVDMMYISSGGSAGWADAAILIPRQFRERYGDDKILEENYALMQSTAEYMIANLGPKEKNGHRDNPYREYLYEKGFHFGEWCEPEEFWSFSEARQSLPHPEEATAYLHYSMTAMAETAQLLGKDQDAERYRRYAEGAKNAYLHEFLRGGAPDTDRQAKLVRPIALGIAEGEIRRALEQRLAKSVINRQGRVGTGFLSTAFLPGVLTEAGYPELAYQTLENREAPGWLWQIDRGATTTCENWHCFDAENPDTGSLNHYSPGAVCSWLFDTVCGIRPAGERRFLIAPVPGGSLTHAAASYRSIYGEVSCGWTRQEGKTVYSVSIPANTSACIRLSGGFEQEVTAGAFTFELPDNPTPG